MFESRFLGVLLRREVESGRIIVTLPPLRASNRAVLDENFVISSRYLGCYVQGFRLRAVQDRGCCHKSTEGNE